MEFIEQFRSKERRQSHDTNSLLTNNEDPDNTCMPIMLHNGSPVCRHRKGKSYGPFTAYKKLK